MTLNLGYPEPTFLAKAKTAISITLQTPNISEAVAPFGYSTEKMNEGLLMQSTSEAIWNNQQKEKQESTLAAMAHNATFDKAKGLLTRHRELARTLYKRKPEILVALNISGSLSQNYSEFMLLFNNFYNNIKNNPNLQSKVLLIGISETVLDEALALSAQLETEHAALVKERGESQVSTQTKNSALIDLKEWLDDFEDVAKVAFYDAPQTLELLGFFVRN